MQADYKLLPKRNGRYDGSYKKWQQCRFFTNFYEIEIDSKRNKIYQYSAEIQQIPDDASEVYFKSIRSISKVLKEKIGLLNWKGKMIWGSKPCKVPLTEKCEFTFKEEKYSHEVLIRQNKEMNIQDLMESEETRGQILQVLNIDMKQKLRMAGMHELGKMSQYYQKNQGDEEQQHDLRKQGLNVLRGFKFTLTPIFNQICLQIDVCSRVLQSKNLLEIFNGKEHAFNIDKFTGSTVITRYGTYRTYRIEEIDYKMNPKSTFHNEKIGASMTYEEYYQKVHMLKVGNNRQPLLKVVGRIKKEIKHGKVVETPEYIYLIPEFVSPTGMTDDQRAQYNIMKLLAPFTKLSPEERVKNCRGMVERFNDGEGGLIKIGAPKRMKGHILDRPNLVLGSGSTRPDERGNMRFRNKLKNVAQFKDWIFAYSLGRNPDRDDDDADKAFDLLSKAGETYGIKLSKPGYLALKARNVDDWKKEVAADIKDNGKPQLIVCYFNPNEEKYYGQLKRFFTNQLQIPSQMIRKKTLTNPKGAMSAASKIDIQINTKAGGVPWEVSKAHPYFKDKNMMYGALSLSKGKKGFTLAFVGTINRECTKVYSQCKVGIKKKEEIPPDLLNKLFINWAKSFYKTNKTVPELIMLYREGLSDSQVQVQLQPEIEALDTMVKEIGAKTKTKNYNPQMVYVIVNKKINSRFYYAEKDNPQQGIKFIPRLSNPPSGSVLMEEMSKDDAFDFHLSAQYVTQGTCTPTHYRVAYDTSKISQQALMNFTYEQCFNYYNWEGAVRVPACLQCADKLAKLAGEHIKQSIVEGQNSKRLFFL